MNLPGSKKNWAVEVPRVQMYATQRWVFGLNETDLVGNIEDSFGALGPP